MATSIDWDRRPEGRFKRPTASLKPASVALPTDLRIRHVEIIDTESQAARPTVVPLDEDLKSVRVQDGSSQSYSESPALEPFPLARDVLESL